MTRLQAAELLDAFDAYLDAREQRFVHNHKGELREYRLANLEAQAHRERLIDRFCDEEPTQPMVGRR